jgi:hypothetical protein
MVLIDAATVGQDSPTSTSSGWSRSDVIALVTLLIGIPAAIVAAVILKKAAKRRHWRGNSKYIRFCRKVNNFILSIIQIEVL